MYSEAAFSIHPSIPWPYTENAGLSAAYTTMGLALETHLVDRKPSKNFLVDVLDLFGFSAKSKDHPIVLRHYAFCEQLFGHFKLLNEQMRMVFFFLFKK